MEKITLKVKLHYDSESGGCWMSLPFDPKEKFGKVRMPVVVTINKHSYRTTICRMGGEVMVIVNKANRAAAGIGPEDEVAVTIQADHEPRVVTLPPDLKKAIGREKSAKMIWEKLSFTHQREYVEWIEEAKKPETRARRVEKTVEQLVSGGSK